jgi:hypothetical protein
VDFFAAIIYILPALIQSRFFKAFASKEFKPFLFFGMDVVFLIPNKLNKMKKINFLVAAAFTVVAFTACNNSDKSAKADAENLTIYVDSVESAPRVYTAANWTAIDAGYNMRAAKADSVADKLSADEKAKADLSRAKYNALKAEYEAKIKQMELEAKMTTSNTGDYRTVLRNNLFGEGKIGTDMSFAFVNANNILDVYKKFVNTVDDNKNNYSREDWDEIKVLYEALDTRKNVVEKEGIATGDNLKIAGLKIKFAAIKATHRGVSKVEENNEAKH